MSDVVIWHNPRCSKSRQTLSLLEERGLDPVVRLYLEEPPSAEEISEAQTALGQPLIAMTRVKEALFRELGLTRDMPEAELLAALTANPRLIERPIVLANGKALIGRPPEAVLALF